MTDTTEWLQLERNAALQQADYFADACLSMKAEVERLKEELERVVARQRRDEQQLCEISYFFGKDARHVEGDGPKSIATLVKQEVERLHESAAEKHQLYDIVCEELERLRDAVAYLRENVKPPAPDHPAWCWPDVWTEFERRVDGE
jgi:NAD-dependent DNA ligase